MTMRRAKLCAAGVVAASVLPLWGGPAVADPVVLPVAQDIVGVGAQTTQGVMSRLAADYNASLTDPYSPRLYSWDSTGPSPITTKTGAVPITRPNGAVGGVQALLNTTSATVDFARSDRIPPSQTPPPGFSSIVLARDAVTWSAPAGGNAPAALTPAQLKGVYQCDVGFRTWKQIDPSKPDEPVKPWLPPTASGTRAFFLAAIGNPAPGGCVQTGPEENEGTDPRLNDVNALFPYSVADYLGQTVGGHGTATDSPGALTLRGVVLGSNNVPVPPVANGVINAVFVNSAFGRVVYNAVRDTEWTATDAHGTALRAIFGPTGWICVNATAKADLKSYGFLVTPACGASF
ncbi:substrate-binding domain-containing protein [Kitasatospora sp. NPDC056783]|uniref:substrate-binding domain-containing protein n=1 Tax=Kitasatospora sp. NPDC056783 TaxID=3345943 RepID=UPI00367A4B1D